MEFKDDLVEHRIKMLGNQKGDSIEESYFFFNSGQRYVFRYSLDDRPKIVQHVCAVSRDIDRSKEHYFYDCIFNTMTQFVDLTKLFDKSQEQ
jgi:hypothetical protein